MLVVQDLLLLTTPTANAACKVCGREGHNARTCPQRGTAIEPVQQQQPQGRQQGCSICGEPGHNAHTHAQHAAAATAAAAERTARGEYVCGYCQRAVSGEERTRWLRQLFSVACNASPHLSSGGGILRYPIPKWLLFLNNVGSGFHCLRSLFFFLFLRKGLGLMPDPFQGTIV